MQNVHNLLVRLAYIDFLLYNAQNMPNNFFFVQRNLFSDFRAEGKGHRAWGKQKAVSSRQLAAESQIAASAKGRVRSAVADSRQ